MRKFKAQASTEYIMIIGMVLVITIPLFYYAMRESNVNIKLNNAEDAVNTLARAADVVYSIGPGTTKYVWVNMPKGVESYSLDEKNVLIQVSIFGSVSDIHASTKVDLIGDIPISPGRHKIRVEMLDSGEVLFGDDVGGGADIIPPVITWHDPSGTINYRGIILRVTTNEYSHCKYSTEVEGNLVEYGNMIYDFVGDALMHEADLSGLSTGWHKYYVRCQDFASPTQNAMDVSREINFEIVLSGCASYCASLTFLEHAGAPFDNGLCVQNEEKCDDKGDPNYAFFENSGDYCESGPPIPHCCCYN